jgi:hypothetical protein
LSAEAQAMDLRTGDLVRVFTVHLEDWSQPSFDFDAPMSDRIVSNVDPLMAPFNDCAVQGVLGVRVRDTVAE